MLLVNVLFLSSLIDNYNFHYTKPFLNSLDTFKVISITNEVKVNKIGVVDFRKILRNSNSMKILGQQFISAEKKMNYDLKLKKTKLKNKEKDLLYRKNKISVKKYNYKLKIFKEEVFKIQNRNKLERFALKKSFQKKQKKIKDLLAQIIKEISIKKNINIVMLKENIFLLNDQSIDFTDEAFNSFNEKTKHMDFKIISN